MLLRSIVLSSLRLLGVIVLALSLTGCVRYDVGIHFRDQHHGEIVQHIHIGDQLTSFSDTAAQQWLTSIERRSRQLGGQIRHPSKQDMIVIIPFNNGNDLVTKFNRFFSPPPEGNSQRSTAFVPDTPPILSHLQLNQSNWLVTERNHLTFDLDLQALAVLSSKGNVLVSPGSLLALEFSLSNAWGAQGNGNVPLQVQEEGKRLVWTLNPGVVNHVEATFWVPSPLGMGTVAIALLVIAGISLKSLNRPYPG